jgi:hypothetical protein
MGDCERSGFLEACRLQPSSARPQNVDGMSNDPTFEFFEPPSANALAAQASGMNAQSLAAIAELRRSIAAGHLDVEGTAHLVTEWARGVANASGVAIGRLKGSELVYVAGSGSAASYVGRRVMATFSTSVPNRARAEILRVENTAADDRIESAICRQFGAKSLLILPIYYGPAVAGVLQVLFNEAHAFRDQEVRTYRLLAGLVGEAMSQAVQVDSKKGEAEKPPLAPLAFEKMPPTIRTLLDRDGSVQEIKEAASCSPRGVFTTEVGEIPSVESSLPMFLSLQGTKYRRVYKGAGLAAAGLLVAVTWLLHTGRSSTKSSPDASVPQKSIAEDQHPSMAPAHQPSPTQASPTRATTRPAHAYVADQTQIQRFERATLHPASEQQSRVKHFGDDVTVRYFVPKSAVLRTGADREVRRLSEDVTVRYYRPRNAGVQLRPAGNDVQQPVNR